MLGKIYIKRLRPAHEPEVEMVRIGRNSMSINLEHNATPDNDTRSEEEPIRFRSTSQITPSDETHSKMENVVEELKGKVQPPVRPRVKIPVRPAVKPPSPPVYKRATQEFLRRKSSTVEDLYDTNIMIESDEACSMRTNSRDRRALSDVACNAPIEFGAHRRASHHFETPKQSKPCVRRASHDLTFYKKIKLGDIGVVHELPFDMQMKTESRRVSSVSEYTECCDQEVTTIVSGQSPITDKKSFLNAATGEANDNESEAVGGATDKIEAVGGAADNEQVDNN